MNSSSSPRVMQELPLIRAKVGGAEAIAGTGPNIGPGTYDVDPPRSYNESRAPFNSTSLRPPLSTADPRIPGPGAYEVGADEDGRRGITSVPFVSGCTRFPSATGDATPGPGSYDTARPWVTKKKPITHQFASGRDRFVEPNANGTLVAPGYYNPNHAAAERKNPKASHFAKYSAREAKEPSATPGPGSYDPDRKPRDLYASKPSSMFATAINRYNTADNGNPGPGEYNIPSFLQNPPRKHAETFSAFGSSAGRFQPHRDGDRPGPGAYTGEIAARRPRPQAGLGTAAFASESRRFGDPDYVTPGPGAYDGRRPPNHSSFGAETPFMSTVSRFGPNSANQRPLPFDEETFGTTDPGLIPRSRQVYSRPFVDRDIAPTVQVVDQYPNRSLYYPIYDTQKPITQARSLFGRAPRSTSAPIGVGPGPGAYGVPGGARSTRHMQSSWARDPRFHTASGKRDVEPSGHTYYESTLFTKSHNVTIGSDTMWTDAHQALYLN